MKNIRRLEQKWLKDWEKIRGEPRQTPADQLDSQIERDTAEMVVFVRDYQYSTCLERKQVGIFPQRIPIDRHYGHCHI